MALADALFMTAARLPEKLALVDARRRMTYSDLANDVERFASALQARGVAPGDRVAVLLGNVVEAVVAMYGVLHAGAVFVPISPLVRSGKLAVLLADAGAAALVSSVALAPVFEPAVDMTPCVRTVVVCGGEVRTDAPARVEWECFLAEGSTPARTRAAENGLAAIIYTSGTTGFSKGVMLTHLNMTTVAASVIEYLGILASDVLYCALPLAFSYGICQLTVALPQGATVVLDGSFAYPAKSLALMASERVTCFAGVPTMYSVIANMPNLADFNLGALRILTNAADALPEPILDKVRKALPWARFYSMYGLTECQRVSYLPPEELDRRPGSVGRGMPRQELWLVDADGNRVPPGGTGELVVSGNHVMRGYWGKSRETSERLRPGPRGEAVLHTGDIFRTDSDGYLYFVARKDDIIKTRGEKVSPQEVENVIRRLAGVVECAVVGVPDTALGNAIRAAVVTRPGVAISKRDVILHCRAQLEGYMVPHTVEFVDKLPTTDSGKIHRARLRGQLE